MFHNLAKFFFRIALRDAAILNEEAIKIRKVLQAHGLGNSHATRDKAAFAVINSISGTPEVKGKPTSTK
jgi:hypothetical protein